MLHLRFAVLTAIVLTLAACYGPGPHRTADDAVVAQNLGPTCQALYAATDKQIADIATNFSKTDAQREAFLATMHDTIDGASDAEKPCWHSAYERHTDYDLYYAEFDDAGQATDRAKDQKSFRQSQLFLIENAITNALKDSQQGLNIVVFTHGWHGNARADNDYSTEFKAILQDIALREASYAALGGEATGGNTTGADTTGGNIHRRLPHRVVGIEIAWRGDSFWSPPLFYPGSENALNVWDRKLAAETVSTGSVQELLAFLNAKYLDNSCHGTQRNTSPTSSASPPPNTNPNDSCDRVHLLSLGHSFGALINFRALTPRLESGLNVDPCYRVYGFGDMTILLNPAFEGARYRALFNNAINRTVLDGPYFGDMDPNSRCKASTLPPRGEVQIPSVVTLQSLGDTATGTFFPIFRNITTALEQSLSPQEASDKVEALGWVPDFRTHGLALAPDAAHATDDTCPNVIGPPGIAPAPGAGSAPQGAAGVVRSFCPFRQDAPLQAASIDSQRGTHTQWLQLTWNPATPGLPDYMPLWSVAVTPELMANHDDIWNPQIVRLISVLFERAYEQSEKLHGN